MTTMKLSPEEYLMLKSICNRYEEINKVEDGLNVKIIYESPYVLMITVNDYESSRKIGSRHWCITTSESMWRSYLDGTNKQYFIWDFTKPISDKKHMIGATITANNKVKAAHWADDTSVQNPDTIFDEIKLYLYSFW